LGTGSNGGTPYNPSSKPSPKPNPAAAGGSEVPFFSYDPSIEAQRLEAQRGYEDTTQDVASKAHFAKTDLHQALQAIHIATTQKRQDINKSTRQANQKLDYQTADTEKTAGRREQDFGTTLTNIARNFGQLGQRQAEQANASGVLDAGTQAASAAARGGNQRLAEAPVHTAQERGREDLATALGRIGTAQGEVTADRAQSLGRLKQATGVERAKEQRAAGRKLFEGNRERERAKVEEESKNVASLAEEIYAARAEHPAVFANWKQSHPEAIKQAERKSAGRPAPTGGTKAPSGKGGAKGGKGK
jgi:hypothetical protein